MQIKRVGCILLRVALMLLLGIPQHVWLFDLPLIDGRVYATTFVFTSLFGLLLGMFLASVLHAAMERVKSLPGVLCGVSLVSSCFISYWALIDLLAYWGMVEYRLPVHPMLTLSVGFLSAASVGCASCVNDAPFKKTFPAGKGDFCGESPWDALAVAMASCGVAFLLRTACVDSWMMLDADAACLLLSLCAACVGAYIVLHRAKALVSSPYLLSAVAFGLIVALSTYELYGDYQLVNIGIVGRIGMAVFCLVASRALSIKARRVRKLDDGCAPSGEPEIGEGDEVFKEKTLREQLVRYGLSEGELNAVVGCLGGATSAEVGSRMGVSASTVRSYTQRAYKKIGVRTLKELQAALKKDGGAYGATLSEQGHVRLEEGRPARGLQCDEAFVALQSRTVWTGLASMIILGYLLFLSPLAFSVLPAHVGLTGLAFGLVAGSVFHPWYSIGFGLLAWLRYPVLLVSVGCMVYFIVVVCRGAIDSTLPLMLWDYPISFYGAALFGALFIGGVQGVGAWVLHVGERGESKQYGYCFFCAAVACLLASFCHWLLPVICSFALVVFARLMWVLRQFTGMRGTSVDLDKRPIQPGAIQPQTMIGGMFGSPTFFALGFVWSEYWTQSISFLGAVPFALFSVVACASQMLSLIQRRQFAPGMAVGMVLFIVASVVAKPDMYPIGQSGTFLVVMLGFLVMRMIRADEGCSGPVARLMISATVLGMVSGNLLSSTGALVTAFVDKAPWGVQSYLIVQNAGLVAAVRSMVDLIGCVGAVGLFVLERNREMVQPPTWDSSDERRMVCFFESQGLSPLEAEVLLGIMRGESGREIAERLSYAHGTINTARFSGYQKLGIHSRAQLAELVSERVILKSKVM